MISDKIADFLSYIEEQCQSCGQRFVEKKNK